MQSMPTLKEQIIWMLYEDPGMILAKIYGLVRDSGVEITEKKLGRALAGLKKEGFIKLFWPKDGPRILRYMLERTGYEEAYRIGVLGGKIGFPRNNL